MIKKLYQNFKVYGLQGFFSNFFWEIRMRYRWFFLKSFSQGGEDIIIDKLLRNKKHGFYVDVGAFDPTRFSNTKRFYLKGWLGINIEPDPIRCKTFQENRPRDVSLNLGVANRSGSMDFFRFNPQTLSTFSKKTAGIYQKSGHALATVSKIRIQKLSSILEKYANKKSIDFLSIDTEGLDLEVLKSNNWGMFRPKVICIEGQDKKIDKMLSKLGYKKTYQTVVNSIYRLENDG